MEPNIRAFKNELRNYNYYLSRLTTLTESIEFFYYQLGGVKGKDPTKERTHVPPNKEYEWRLREQITILEQERDRVAKNIDYIQSILAQIKKPLRTAVFEVYCEGKTIHSVSLKMNLSSSGLDAQITKALRRVLHEEIA